MITSFEGKKEWNDEKLYAEKRKYCNSGVIIVL